MILFHISFFILNYFLFNVTGKTVNVISIDENWICNIKTSCRECLSLTQCSWCSAESKCFSEQLLNDESYCENEITRQTNLSLSLEDNAECACAGDEIVSNCHQPNSPDENESKECSGRGSCHCGRCFCDVPDVDNPSKVIIGEYCEFDNFSCDGPKCNEGPYYIYDRQNPGENEVDEVTEVEHPEEQS